MAEINNVIAEASQDLQTIEDFVNLPADSEVYPRLLPSANVGTLAGARQAIFEAGGLPAKPFTTYSQMVASALPEDSYAIVTHDPDISKSGIYRKISGSWVYSNYNNISQIRDYLYKNGKARVVPSSPININYTTADSKLTFSNTVYVITDEIQGLVATPISLTLATNGAYRIEVSRTTRSLRAVSVVAAKENGWLEVGYINRTDSGITTSDFAGYLVNGAAQNQPAVVAKTNYSLILSTPETLNFDFINNKVIVTNNLWLPYDGARILINAQTVELAADRNYGFIHLVLVNPANGTLVIKSQAGYTAPKDHLVIGAYYEPTLTFYGLEHFSVNGKPHGNSGTTRRSFGWSVNNTVKVNVADSFTTSDSLPLGGITSAVVYAWYDALVAAYPDYVTKTLLGNDASGTLPIYQYRFKPKMPTPGQAKVTPKPIKTLLAAYHNESMNFVYMYVLMREICNNWQNSDALTSFRHGVEFVVIPVGNPWGLDNSSRTNSRKVDINRNFPANWVQLGVVGDTYYSGTAPLTESEAQAAYGAMVAESPDVYFDCHSFGPWQADGKALWIPILNSRTQSAALSASTKIYAQYKKDYSWMVSMDKFIDFSDETILGGGISSKSAAALGAIGGTLETSWNLKGEPSGDTGHVTAVNFGADILGTLILQCIGVLISE